MHIDQADLVNQIVIGEKRISTNLITQVCSERKASAVTHEETASLPVHSGFQGVFCGSLNVLGQGKLDSSTAASLTESSLVPYIQI